MAYQPFSKYVLRAPLFSFTFYKKLTQNDELEKELKKICSDPIIKEAIFLASPALFSEFEKWLSGAITDKNKSDKMMYAVLKYISRMSSRCTPFGLFAGTAVGAFANETQIELHDSFNYKRHTRLDMNYLVALSQEIVTNENIRSQLLFYPNTSIYTTGHQLRYVEYTYVNSKRIHHIVGVEQSEYLEKVIQKAQHGALLKDLAMLLVDDEITIDDAQDFINQLVDSQLLISELEPSVSGPEFLDQILPVLKKLRHTTHLVSVLENTQTTLEKLDERIGNTTETYINLGKSLEKLDVGFQLKYMFQTDMLLSTASNVLDKKWIHKVRQAITFLNKLSLPPKDTPLSAFKAAFYERYEEREVPLSKALDVELGVGFLQNQGLGDVSAIVDDIILPQKNEDNIAKDIKWSPVVTILQKKLIESIAQHEHCIVLSDADFEGFEANWDDLPDTISSMIEIVTHHGEEKVVLSSAGGSSAANLLGRFCHGDPELYDYTQEILQVEQQQNPDKILAEIVHLPESRVGNILMRPAFRSYEIPYLAKSILDVSHQLTLDDLMISTTAYGPITLRSKKYDKEVLPHLTNAHNYSANALPIYQFLANLQTQNQRSGIGFNWGPLVHEYDFLPRVEYKEIIISSATWNIKQKEIKSLVEARKNNEIFKAEVQKFVASKKIPQYVLLIDGDNELLINTANIASMLMLLDTIKNRSAFQIKEFLHVENSIVTKDKEHFTNQLIISFYNDKKLKNSKTQYE
ncbi:lantibiotic dehydratase family protein [Aquimarina sp. U1-2]|uniref:lantibiotic dehydratase family protein n=1 Tax=Aquimarina sp. U1-2 TaxID=2823141 RepID=UPI001AECCF2B|nr:lantibiotic dehydratase family protein [Aquimarina sp. U1-2]MBP2834102.1 lantibiotic dehydratase family protein [Aquimarina sp. U1-2]